MMQQRGEHRPFVSFRCLTYAAQRLEHAFPALRPVRVPLCSAFSLAPALGLDPLRGSSPSATGLPVLFGDFTATTAESDFSPPCIIGVRLSPSQCGPCP